MTDFKQFLNDVQSVVEDYNQTKLSFATVTDVPNINDIDMTFGNGVEKKGKMIKTCVLYVDIRNSVQLSKDHTYQKMGKVFSAFTRSVQMAAERHNGFIRNIIGDRVMVVFPAENCFSNAVHCAITINHLVQNLLNKKIYGLDFQCGIGIDYGEMYCIKVGKIKQNEENNDNKALVWVGLPANQASRLTDCANKDYSEKRYKVLNYLAKYINPFSSSIKPLNYNKPVEGVMTGDEAMEHLLDGDSLRIEVVEREQSYHYHPILVSEAVYNGYKSENPDCNSFKESMWKLETKKIKDVDFKVYGADLVWRL